MVREVAGTLEGGRLTRDAAVPRAASFGLDGGAGRRRAAGAAGRGQPRASRRAVPRRAARVPARGARFAAPAARDRHGQRRARQCPCHLPGAGPADRGDEPVPLRASRRCRAGLRARAALRRRLSGARSRGRCSTASTCTSRCARSAPPTSSCRRPPKARPRSPPVAAARARADRALCRHARRTNAEADGKLLDAVATPDEPGRQAARPGGRGDAAVGARLSPRAARRAHDRRSGGSDGVGRSMSPRR